MTGNGSELVFAPLGGVGEIGMNLGLYGLGPEDDRTWLVVDFGISFGDPTLPGVDLVLPDIRYLEAERHRIAGIVITHAHEDHFGALPYIWEKLRAPIYATPFTAGLLAAKLSGYHDEKIPVRQIMPGERYDIGPFNVEPVPVSHSIPEPNALAIRTEFGLTLHTGDWKIDPHPGLGLPLQKDRFRALGQEGVTTLVCDSTNAIRDGISPSEKDVAESLRKIIQKAKHRVAVTTFASNVARIKAVAEAAVANGRDVVLIGRAMRRMVDVATELGYMEGLPPFLDQDAYGYIPREKVVALCTGSQGESRAAMARIARQDHPDVTLNAGDLAIFSSRAIPGNEKSVGDILNALASQNIDIITDKDALVHVTGHPRRDELRQMYEWTQPKTLIPVHGEPYHLREHAKLGRACGIKKVVSILNGDMVRLQPGKPEIIDQVPSGRWVKDGHIIADPELCGIRERRKLAFAGSVTVAVTLTRQGEVAADALFDLKGLPELDQSGTPMIEVVDKAVYSVLNSLPKAKMRDTGLTREAIRRSVRSAVHQVWGKKTNCTVLVSVV